MIKTVVLFSFSCVTRNGLYFWWKYSCGSNPLFLVKVMVPFLISYLPRTCAKIRSAVRKDSIVYILCVMSKITQINYRFYDSIFYVGRGGYKRVVVELIRSIRWLCYRIELIKFLVWTLLRSSYTGIDVPFINKFWNGF